MVLGVAEYGSATALRKLLALGAPVAPRRDRPSFDGSGGETALEVGAKRGDADIVAALLERNGPKWEKKAINQALFNGAATGSAAIVGRLVLFGGDPRFRTKDGKTVLMAAASSAVSDALGPLLPKYAMREPAPNETDNKGRTALFYVADGALGHIADNSNTDRAKVIQILVEIGAHVDHRDNDGNTALITNGNYANVTRALIKAGADVNAQNKAGETALMKAGTPDVLTVLLDAGANPNLRNAKGETALDAARNGWGAEELVPAFEKWLAKRPKKPAADKR